MLSACAERDGPAPVEFERSETHIDYEVELTGVSDAEVLALMERALSLYRLQDKGAQSLAFLRRRAQGDVETARKILRSFGWYGAEAEVSVIDADGDVPARARVAVTEGRRYTLGAHRILLVETGASAPPAPDAAALGSPVGGPAGAKEILTAETAAVDQLQAGGRPYARRLGRDAVADPDAASIEVETTIATGDAYVIGAPRYSGGEGVKRAYLDTYQTWEDGAQADLERLKEMQRALAATGLFETIAVKFPDEPPTDGVAPVEITLEEAKPRTVSGGLLYNTDAGPAVRGGFEHRNLFGANETLTLEALAGLEEQSIDARYRIPQYLQPGQDLVFGTELRRIDDEAFDELGATLAVGIERELSDEITVGIGALAEISRTKTRDETETAKLFGLPAFIAFDSSDDLLDPSKGYRLRLAATPYGGFQGGEAVSFGVIDATGSAYFDLTGEKMYILAARARLATALSEDIDVISPSRRLYAGGGGSVRGYAERFIGPLDGDGDPTGGRSAAEIGAELRARVAESVGVAAFVEAGSVTEDVAPTFDEGLLIAAGAGVRYFSPVGPIRLDVGVPVNPRRADDSFQVYISIGQAF